MFARNPRCFRELLPQDHERLDAMLASVLELVHVDLRPQLQEHWVTFEDGMLTHMNAEEMFILPAFGLFDAASAAILYADHAKLRGLLAEVGAGLDMDLVREEQVQELAQTFRAHAKAEKDFLYEWADRSLPPTALSSLARRLRATWERSWSRAAQTPASVRGDGGAKRVKRSRARI